MKLIKHILVDITTMKPISSDSVLITEAEAIIKNRAFRMNHTIKKYIKE